ncbi:SRPBCC family protein [Corallococcus carmarthensis]|uniref:SRPBCC family protein n=1 Tax=Corallococcus carmarthensis TaxID=2316728 RepID=A0A3A8KPZ0_9BACT|nr:SRPBCC family protein [Corallococcus carmarthensis]NOK17113.1 SRPBCC family protein [Corallococcus carmarthensis]RKH06235.1 SRPBCC family protein [Corallococcus carmarthensis]
MASSRTMALHEARPQENTSGEDLLSQRWSKTASAVVAGTLMSLGLKRRSLGGTLVALAGGALLYQGLGSRRHAPATVARRARRALKGGEARRGKHLLEVERTITVGRPADVLYRLWREPSTLSRLMANFADVTPTDGDGRHWQVHGPLGREMSWDSHLVEDRPPEFMRWESTGNSPMETGGWVRFKPAPANWGTEVTLHLAFSPPGGVLAEALAKRLHAIPAMQMMKTLRRFKSLAETGEMPTLDHNPSARVSAD